MSKKNSTITLVFFLLTLFTQAQDTTQKPRLPLLWNIEGAYHYQGTSAAELGINFTRYLYGSDNLCEVGLYFSGEYHFNSHRNFWAPKIGIGLDECFYKLKGWGYTTKANLLWMDPGELNEWKLLPQAGITWAGIFNVYYGYLIPLSSQASGHMGLHRLTVSFNIGYVRSLINIIDLGGGM